MGAPAELPISDMISAKQGDNNLFRAKVHRTLYLALSHWGKVLAQRP